MSGIKVQGSATGAGNFTITPPNGGASDRVITLPDRSGNVSMNGPIFRVVRTATTQAVSSNIVTKVQLNSTSFDSDNSFDAVTNFRFQPTVAGYYQFIYAVDGSAAGGTLLLVIASLGKNGALLESSDITQGAFVYNPTAAGATEATSSGSDVVYLNGTTDYTELYARVNGTSPVIQRARLSGSFIRP